MIPNTNHQLELKQLWFIAQYYLQLANELVEHMKKDGCSPALDESVKDLGAAFDARCKANRKELNVYRAVAHFSSAAIRLATIEERLDQPYKKSPALRDYYRQVHATEHDKSSFIALFSGHYTDWLHIMLRHNVAHIERADDKSNHRKDQYEARQGVIESMTPNEIGRTLEGIAWKICTILKAEGILGDE